MLVSWHVYVDVYGHLLCVCMGQVCTKEQPWQTCAGRSGYDVLVCLVCVCGCLAIGEGVGGGSRIQGGGGGGGGGGGRGGRRWACG